MPSPTALEIAPDGRVFVAQQAGALRIIKNGSLLPTPFLTLNVDSLGERGLLGLAFDPDFITNQYIYLYYTAPSPASHNRVSRFTANGDLVVAGSEVILLELNNLSTASNHNGGGLHFGPDGKLYVAVGENALPANSQTLTNLLGKMLRLNRDGTIPTDNPFYATAVGVNRSIWALGLRNPYTFAFQPGTGRLFINDVGQSSWEEINEGVAGANYGWPSCEGNCVVPNASFRDPFFTYPAGSGTTAGHAIAGGAFYNPATVLFPSSYVGSYFFADYVNGWIRRLEPANGNTTTVFASSISQPLDLKVSSDGTLYYLARGGGTLYAVKYSPVQLPQVLQQPASQTVSVGQSATFSILASGTAPLSYQWQRNGVNIVGANGSSYTLGSASLADNAAQFRCLVTNLSGTSTSDIATLTVSSGSLPVATILQPVVGQFYSAGDTIPFAGTGSDKEDGSLPASAMSWTVVFHHDTHTHPFIGPINGVSNGSFVVPTEGETAANVWYRVYLTVTDSVGQTHTTFVDIAPRLARIDLKAALPGLQLTLDGQPVVAPYSVASVAGMRRTIGVTSSQVMGGATYDFASWSDAGSATHSIVSPLADTTYEAYFSLRRDPQTGSATFANSASLTIPALGSATLYPTSIPVAGLYGAITQMAVTLKGLNHTFPDDLDMILVSPGAQTVLLMSDAGGDADLVNVDLGFDTTSSVDLPDASVVSSGNYRPTNFGASDLFPTPAPVGPYASTFGGVLGSAPKGNWSLYLVDDEAGDAGSLARGWQLTLNVATTPPTISDIMDQTTDGISAMPPVTFQVTDAETPSSELLVISHSSDQVLLPDSNLTLTGTGSNRALQVVPASGKVGITTVTVTVSDGFATATDSFVLSIGNLNQTPTISAPPDQTIQQGQRDVSLSFTVNDLETAASNLVVTVSSSNTGLIPQSALLLVGVGNQRSLIINPEPSQVGVSAVTLTVRDGAGASMNDSFEVNVVSGGATGVRFSNPNLISVPQAGAASPYPSSISVSGFVGNLGRLKVNLQGVNHPWPDDLQILLVGPAGHKVLLMASAGGGTDLLNASLVFDQVDGVPLPDSLPIMNGSFLPTAFGQSVVFPPGAPIGPYSTSLNDLIGTDPNGAWSLYVYDAATGDRGDILNGWSLEIFPVSSSNLTVKSAGPISIPSVGAGSPYPSTLQVSGLSGTLDHVTVAMTGVSHTWPDDIAALLVGPSGESVMLMAAAGGSTPLINLNLNFDDLALNSVPDQGAILSGTYRPSSYGGVPAFPSPAPAAPYSTSLGAFAGTSPNGNWSLYVMDTAGGDLGNIQSGWSLTLDSSVKQGSTKTFSNAVSMSLPSSGGASVYPSVLPVSGMSGVIDKLTVAISGLSHTWPDDLDILLVGPLGQKVILMSDAGGASDLVNVDLVFDPLASGILSDDQLIGNGSYLPANYGAPDTFPAPAPLGPYGTALAAFYGSSPNGIWSLYVVDDEAGDLGVLAGGWSLSITTIVPPSPAPVLLSTPAYVRFGPVSVLPTGQIRLLIETEREAWVSIEYSSDLENWQELKETIQIDGVVEVVDPTEPKPESRFYRARLLK